MADLSALRARFRQDSLRLEGIRRELQGQTFEGRSEDDRITVTVTADGHLDDVRFDPRVFRTPVGSDRIASSVKYAYQCAIELATTRKNELYGSALGVDSDAVAASISSDDEAIKALQLGRALTERAESDGRHD